MIYLPFQKRTFYIGLGLALLAALLLCTVLAARNHGETTRWAVLNHTLHFGATTVALDQISMVNYGDSQRFYLPLNFLHKFPFSHIIWSFPDKIENGIYGLVYFYGPFRVEPSRSLVTISAEIRYLPGAGVPDLAFSLEGCQDARRGFTEKASNAIFSDVLTGHVPWTQERFVLTITDRKTGMSQRAIIQPAKWKTVQYTFGDLRAPSPPTISPQDTVVSGFLTYFEINKIYNRVQTTKWKDYIVPQVKDTFPWHRMVVRQGGKTIGPSIGLCTWEGPHMGFENVYSYELRYFEESATRPFARQKLYFVRWDDTWKVLDVDPLRREIHKDVLNANRS